MTLHFDLNQEDYLQYNYYLHEVSPAVKRAKIIYGIFPVIMLGSTFYIHGLRISEYGSFEYVTIILSLFFISRILFYKAYLRLQVSRILKRDPNRFQNGERTLTLETSKLTLSTADTKTELAWSSFTKLGENKAYIFLFINTRQAVIIPKKIFLLDQELYNVQSFIENRLNQQKTATL